MSRFKSVFAVNVGAAIMALALSASATAPKAIVVASGSSAMWTTIALAAFNNGNCPTASVKVTPPCFHYTNSANFNLNDTRPTKVPVSRGGPGVKNVDQGAIWIVWDSSLVTNYWAYIKVDSVVGNRCFFANPVCNISTAAPFPAAANAIPSTLWGGDSTPPAALQTLFTAAAGVKVNAAATDIRPEDAIFAECRVNSALGNGTINGGGDDGLDGLGYNINNPSGVCPAYNTTKSALKQLVGNPIKSGYAGGSTSTANVLAFNISGKDPFTNLAVPAYSTISVGADAITFVYQKSGSEGSGGLTGLTNVTDSQLQTLFSGTDCDAANVLSLGTSPNPIAVFLREPLSGTMNTTEATEFRRPVEVPGGVIGVSQETGVGAANPLAKQPCASGTGIRSRGLGTGEEVKSVLNSFSQNAMDGIGYTFFSFGNVSSLQNAATYAYVQLDSVDPIFNNYAGGQPGEPGNGTIPGSKNVCGGGGFPCTEAAIWGSGNLSFPHLRDGSYPAWSLLRFVATTASKTNVTDLLAASHQYAVNSIPDYVPALGVPTGCTGASCTDPGLQLIRDHYQQFDGNGSNLGPAPNDGTFNSNNNPNGGDFGGDMGGCIKSTPESGNFGVIQTGPGSSCSASPVR